LSREIFALTDIFERIIKASVKLISTSEAAAKLGVTVARVQALIWSGRLPAQKIGRDYIIKEYDLRLVAHRKPGRPPLKSNKKTTKKLGGKSNRGK
jgi:excisionase family DNA binding protein